MRQWNTALWEKRKYYWCIGVCNSKRPREIWQHWADFWIKKNEIFRLFERLYFSESTACCPKNRCDCIVVLCILLKKRPSYCYRCKVMVPLFGQNPHRTSFDICTRFYLSTSPSQTRVIEFIVFTTATFTEICEFSSWKRCTYNYFEFFDGTITRICRPVLNERVVHSHHTGMHGVKYQSVFLPNGFLPNTMPWHGLLINLCFYMETMLNQTVYLWGTYLVYGFWESAKTYLYGNKADYMFKNKPNHCYAIAQRWKSIEHRITIRLSSSVIKWCTSTHEKGFWNSWFRRFSEIMVKIGDGY